MKEQLKATTKRMIPILAQIVQRHLPGHKIEELAAGEKIKAREFSYSAQVYLLMLGQLAHVFSLNELVDLSTIFSGELRRIRGIEAVKLHMVANVANMLPRFAVVGKASEHDSRREEEPLRRNGKTAVPLRQTAAPLDPNGRAIRQNGSAIPGNGSPI